MIFARSSILSVLLFGLCGELLMAQPVTTTSNATPAGCGQNCHHPLPAVGTGWDLPGWRGKPYSDPGAAGCRCGRHGQVTYYDFSSHWASPWSVWADRGPKSSTARPRLRDNLDHLAQIRLLPDVRRDNGYRGSNCDPYGHLGLSRRPQPLPSESSLTDRQSSSRRVPSQ